MIIHNRFQSATLDELIYPLPDLNYLARPSGMLPQEQPSCHSGSMLPNEGLESDCSLKKPIKSRHQGQTLFIATFAIFPPANPIIRIRAFQATTRKLSSTFPTLSYTTSTPPFPSFLQIALTSST